MSSLRELEVAVFMLQCPGLWDNHTAAGPPTQATAWTKAETPGEGLDDDFKQLLRQLEP